MATFDSYLQGTPSWIEHSSADQQASKQFYGQLFGWGYNDETMMDDQGNDVGTYSLATVQGDQVAGLGPVMQPDQPASWGVYLATDDVDAAVERAREAGGQVNVEPMDLPDQGRMAWVQDPTGATVGLWQDRGFAGSVRANEPGTNIWNELVTPDFQQAAPFYQQTLGIEPRTMDMGEDGPYHLFAVEGRSVAGHAAPQTEGVPPHWNVYFNVEDVDATVARATELGGVELSPAHDVPGVGRMGFLQDPQGAAFNLMQNPPEAE